MRQYVLLYLLVPSLLSFAKDMPLIFSEHLICDEAQWCYTLRPLFNFIFSVPYARDKYSKAIVGRPSPENILQGAAGFPPVYLSPLCAPPENVFGIDSKEKLDLEFAKWSPEKMKLEVFLRLAYGVEIINPKCHEPPRKIFESSIRRHIAMFYGDYLLAGGHRPRPFDIPTCASIEIFPGHERSDAELEKVAGSQASMKFKDVQYGSKKITLVSKNFDNRDREVLKKGELIESLKYAPESYERYWNRVNPDAPLYGPDTRNENYFKAQLLGQGRKPLKKKRKRVPSCEYDFRHELDALNRLQHPNIIQAVCYRDSPREILYPFIRGGDLVPLEGDRLAADPDDLFLPHITRQLVKVLNYVHRAGIVHLDMKPENFMLALPQRNCDWHFAQLILVDFGVSVFENELNKIGCYSGGTRLSKAPEQIDCRHSISYYTDWWGLGAALYRMRIDWEPSIGEQVSEKLIQEIEKRKEGKELPPFPLHAPLCAQFIKKLTRIDPEDRNFDDSLDELLEMPYISYYRRALTSE